VYSARLYYDQLYLILPFLNCNVQIVYWQHSYLFFYNKKTTIMRIFKPLLPSVITLLLIVFFACKKNATQSSLSELSQSAVSKTAATPAPPPAFVFTVPTFGTSCITDGSYCFDASFTNKGGNDPGGNNSITVSLWQLGVQIGSDQVVNSTSGNFCFNFTDLGLTAGQYTVLVYFRHAGSDNAHPVNVPLTFTLTIQSEGDCGGGTFQCTADGVSLTRSSTIVEADETGKVVNVAANYIVHNCRDQNITRLKLQGGLVNKAALLSSPTNAGDATNVNYKLSTSNGNNVLTWTFDLPAGGTHTFSVYYTVWGTACNGPLSGAWSLKNSSGVPIGVAPGDMSATQAGYLDRLYWNCP
jgi:hypothetical protein